MDWSGVLYSNQTGAYRLSIEPIHYSHIDRVHSTIKKPWNCTWMNWSTYSHRINWRNLPVGWPPCVLWPASKWMSRLETLNPSLNMEVNQWMKLTSGKPMIYSNYLNSVRIAIKNWLKKWQKVGMFFLDLYICYCCWWIIHSNRF